MGRTIGIPLVDLFDLTDRISSALPPVIENFIDRFAAIDHRVLRSPGAVIHHGKLQSITAAVGSGNTEFDIGIGSLALPLVHSGIPFQLSMSRGAIVNNLEPASDAWQLNLFLSDFILTIDGLEPAIYVPETGATPRHLVRDTSQSDVRIIGSAVLRLQKQAGSGNIDVLFVDHPDPLHPALPSGAAASLTFSPSSFFLGSSQVGLTVGQLLFDFSDSYSPPQILEQNQGPAWTGLAIQEATVYAPRNLPVVGDLSGGVRNLLLGRPLGINGEFELQFGRTALDPTTFQFRQQPDDTNRGISGSGTSRIVAIEAGHDEAVEINAGFTTPAPPAAGTLPVGAVQNWTARWVWGTDPAIIADTSSGTIRHGSLLTVEPIEIVTVGTDVRRFNHPPITFRFVAAGENPIAAATAGTQTFDNVVHLSGTVEDIAALTLNASSSAPGTSEFVWGIEAKNISETSASFSPDFSGLTGNQQITLKEKVSGEDTHRVSRIGVRLIETGELLVGCETGVFEVGGAATALDLSAVEATFDLSDFHADGLLNSKREQAVLDPGTAANVNVPNDGLAQVVITDPGAPAVTPVHDRHVQVLMVFEQDAVTTWGEKKPRNAGSFSNEADLQGQLLEWASHYPGSEFLVIGRCDDVGQDVPGESPDPFNIDLATDRAVKGRNLLTNAIPGAAGTPIDNTRVFSRGESSLWSGSNTSGNSLEEDAAIAMGDAEKSEATSNTSLAEGWLIKHDHPEHTTWVNANDTSKDYESFRTQYRRIDIYAVGGTPTADAEVTTGREARNPVSRRSFVPANDRTPAPVPSSAPAIDYRVKLLFKWNSPTVSEWKDAIPTLAEAEFAWTPQELPLPQIGGEAVGVSQEVLTVYAKWIHDARTGFTRTTLGLRSDGDPDGLVSTDQKNLTAALAFGPMLLSGVDFDTDVIGSGARIAALLVGIGAAGAFIKDGSKAALMQVEAEAQTRSISDPGEDYQIKLTAEYVTTIHVDGGALGIKTKDDRPMKIRYKNAGIEFDSSKPGWEKIGLAYETDSMEIEDSGQWEIDGVLGELLRIVEIAFGRGSLWIEGRIAIAINIGVIEISEAIIRLTFHDGNPVPDFELRGFVVKADIAQVLKGEGRLRIEDGGVIRAGVDASIIPVGLAVNAAIAFGKPPEIDPDVFLSLSLGVQFSTPLPLGPSGAALYGMKGLFVMNGERDLGTNPDPIGRELDWWAANPEDKYKPKSGQYALGVGVVVGTMPDVSFCFSASGMIAVGFPDPEVILGVDVNVIEVPNTTVSDEGSPSGTITGLIVIDDEAVKVAVSAQYEIPKVLKLKVPFGGYFPYAGTGTYVRLGSDGRTEHGRHGEPITIELLPGTLDVKAWAYLMIEEGGLPELGGEPGFDFYGFSVGFGSGFGIDWSAGPIKLTASAKILVGFGTKPLLIKGGVFVRGELDLVILSISAHGSLILTYLDGDIHLEGEFCGEVDLFFFSISGCVGVEIGGSADFDPPPPEPPIASISLTDRRDQIMGTGVVIGQALGAEPIFAMNDDGGNDGASIDENNTVWPDTAPVLHFTHYIANGIAAGGQFALDPVPSQPIWFGGNRLKYTYRLDGLTLRKKGGAVVAGTSPLQSVWMPTPYRHPDSSGVDNPLPSEHEGPNLKLLDWNPWNWVVNMDDGGESTNGDPAEEVENICDPVPQPRPACVFGRAATSMAWHRVRFNQETPALPPYPSRFYAMGEPVVRSGSARLIRRDLQALLAASGGSMMAGHIMTLPFSVPHGTQTLTRGYRLPRAERATVDGLISVPLPWEAEFDRELTRPSVRLLVCERDDKPGSDKNCTEFEGLRPDGKHTEIVHGDMEIKALDGRSPFHLSDQVNTAPNPDRPGSDGKPDILVPTGGIEITFRRLCRQVELYFMIFTDQDFEVAAFGANGQQVANNTVSGPNGVPLTTRVNASDGIARIIVKGGGGKSTLYRICCIGPIDGSIDPPNPDKDCENFRTLKPRRTAIKKLEHGGFVFTTPERGRTFSLVDNVDQSGATPAAGTDRSAEIRFPDAGIRIQMDHPCERVEVWVMLFSGQPAKVVAFNANNKPIATATSQTAQRRPHRIVLSPDRGGPITHLLVSGGSNEAVIFRICCLGKKEARKNCITFANARIGNDSVSAFTHGNMTFTDISRSGRLQLVDIVDAQQTPAKAGTDNIGDLKFSGSGLRIDLKVPCDAVEIRLMLFAGAVKGQALNALGARTDQANTSTVKKTEQVLSFKGPGITTIELSGGGEKAFIYEICCLEPADGPSLVVVPNLDIARPDLLTPDHLSSLLSARLDDVASIDTGAVTAAAAATSKAPSIRGIIDGVLADTWPGKVIDTRSGNGRTCSVIEYKPSRGRRGPWDGFQLISQLGRDVTLLSICGVDQIMVQRQSEDQAARDDRQNSITDTMGTDVTERREILLEPGEDYEIIADWSWQAWQSNEDGTNEPPAVPPAANWQSGTAQHFHFAVADADTNTGNTQDGLNEYVFDARDVSRFLNRVEPEDGRSVQFTDDPLWAHFDLGHVEGLLEQYDRELFMEVKRTDPPPQSSPAALVVALVPLIGTFSWMTSPAVLEPTGYGRINDAVLNAPCLPAGPLVGGASLMGEFDLDPNAMYDFNVLAVRSDGTDPLVVSATRFVTSRYADPEGLIDHLGYNRSGTSPYAPDDIILPSGASLPGGPMEVSDALMDNLLREMEADTLPIPHRTPASYVVWRQTGSSWQVEGILIDSLESLNRLAAVQTSGGSDIVTRFKIDRVQIGSTVLNVHRANENWTRVYLKPASPISLSAGRHELRAVFETSDGSLSGRRTLSHQPAIIESEGL